MKMKITATSKMVTSILLAKGRLFLVKRSDYFWFPGIVLLLVNYNNTSLTRINDIVCPLITEMAIFLIFGFLIRNTERNTP